ncbi:MAG: hypothetical protein II893_01125 [Methanomicrobium sp.]|nr:hypothetical protein [Methanomicrobium sp.]
MASAILAVILSFFIPGLGQFYTGQFLKAVGLFVLTMFFGHASYTLYVTGTYLSYSLGRGFAFLAFLIYLFLWVYGMYDAYCSAKNR